MTICTLVLAGLAVMLAPTACDGADWPHYRGPTRTGIIEEPSGYDQGIWPPQTPLWTAQVGLGASSPVVFDGRVFATGWSNGHDSLYALDAASGEVIWRQQYACPDYSRHHAGDEGCYRGPSSTPTVDPATGLIYTLSIDGHLNCWRAGTGEHVWSLDVMDTYGITRRPNTGGGVRDYGYTTSPLVQGELLIVEVGASEGNLMAFDKRTGERRWSSACTDPAGHTSGLVPMVVGDTPCVAVVTLHNLLICRTDAGHEGETLARYPWQTYYANNIVGPSVDGDNVILTSGYNISKTVRLKISPGKAELVWAAKQFSKVCTPMIHSGHVYFAWRALRCLDYGTGAEVWSGGKFGDDASCVLTADKRLIVFGDKRLALVASAVGSPTAYRELATTGRLFKTYCWPHLVVSDGRLLLKDIGGTIICFGIGQ